jgi:hypothetical protein
MNTEIRSKNLFDRECATYSRKSMLAFISDYKFLSQKPKSVTALQNNS